MRARVLPPGLRRPSFHVHAADRAGVHRERLRRADLERPTRSVRWHRARPPEGVDRIRAFGLVLGPGQFVSHTSAAVLWDLPLPVGERGVDPVHVTSVLPAAQMRRRGVRGHRTSDGRAAVRRRWGLPTSHPATTWVECGALLALDDLVALGDAVVTSRTCGTSVADLARALRARGRCPGARTLRAALLLIRVGPGSAPESHARLGIVRAGLPEPELQVEVLDDAGRFVGRVDMAYPAQRIIIEYEGDHHRTDRDQWELDVHRHRAFSALGWVVLRWTRRDLTVGRTAALAELAARLADRAYRPHHGEAADHGRRGPDRDESATSAPSTRPRARPARPTRT